MYSNTNPGYGGKGAPPTKPRVGGGYQRRLHYPRRENKRPATMGPERATFSGLTEDLKGYIYDVETGSQADQFTITNKAMVSYARRK